MNLDWSMIINLVLLSISNVHICHSPQLLSQLNASSTGIKNWHTSNILNLNGIHWKEEEEEGKKKETIFYIVENLKSYTQTSISNLTRASFEMKNQRIWYICCILLLPRLDVHIYTTHIQYIISTQTLCMAMQYYAHGYMVGSMNWLSLFHFVMCALLIYIAMQKLSYAYHSM